MEHIAVITIVLILVLLKTMIVIVLVLIRLVPHICGFLVIVILDLNLAELSSLLVGANFIKVQFALVLWVQASIALLILKDPHAPFFRPVELLINRVDFHVVFILTLLFDLVSVLQNLDVLLPFIDFKTLILEGLFAQ